MLCKIYQIIFYNKAKIDKNESVKFIGNVKLACNQVNLNS